MNWHRDDFGYKSFYLYLFLSDINDDNGPFYCVREKEKLEGLLIIQTKSIIQSEAIEQNRRKKF